MSATDSLNEWSHWKKSMTKNQWHTCSHVEIHHSQRTDNKHPVNFRHLKRNEVFIATNNFSKYILSNANSFERLEWSPFQLKERQNVTFNACYIGLKWDQKSMLYNSTPKDKTSFYSVTSHKMTWRLKNSASISH